MFLIQKQPNLLYLRSILDELNQMRALLYCHTSLSFVIWGYLVGLGPVTGQKCNHKNYGTWEHFSATSNPGVDPRWFESAGGAVTYFIYL